MQALAELEGVTLVQLNDCVNYLLQEHAHKLFLKLNAAALVTTKKAVSALVKAGSLQVSSTGAVLV